MFVSFFVVSTVVEVPPGGAVVPSTVVKITSSDTAMMRAVAQS